MPRIPYNQIAAIRADYHEALRTFHPGRVEVLRAYTPPGLLCCIRVRVHAQTHSVGRSKKPRPRPSRFLDFEIRVRKGYPVLAPVVLFYGGRILASPNVNCMGVFLRNQRGADNRIPAIVTEVLRAILFIDLYEAPEGDDSDRAAAMFHAFYSQKADMMEAISREEYEPAIRSIAEIGKEINAFMDNNMALCEDPKVRANRLAFFIDFCNVCGTIVQI